jgi:hypothetical protein
MTATNPAMPATVPSITAKIDTLFVLLLFLMLLISLSSGPRSRPALKYEQGTCRRFGSNNLAAQDQKNGICPQLLALSPY